MTDLAAVIRQAFIDAGAIYGTDAPTAAILAAANEAVAAERERIRQLADKHHATAAVDCRCTDPSTHEPDAGHYVRFADLLAEDG